MYFYRNRRSLGVAPVVGYAIKVGATSLAKKIFNFGPSSGFQSRQAASDQFFATRNAIIKLEPQMTPQQFAEWKALPHQTADYNLRRENDAERNALYAFLEKLQTPEAWAKPAVTPAAPGASPVTAGALPTGGVLESPMLLIAIAGLAAFLFLT